MIDKKYVLILLVLFFIAINSVNATSDIDLVSNSSDDELSADNLDNILSEQTGTFTELQELVSSGGTIDLTKDYKFDSSTDDDFNDGISISRSVTINGNNHVIDAQGQGRIFEITASNVILKDLTIINGYYYHYRYNNDYGGAIYWSGSNGQVINSTFKNNYADDTGGAIYWAGSNGKITNSHFDNNTAYNGQGGAIYAPKNANGITISNSNFTNNKVLGSAGYGGALYFWTCANAVVINSRFINNSATNGGAIGGDSSNNAQFTSLYFKGNKGYRGGAIYWYRGEKATLKNSTFIENNATSTNGGGAIHWYNSPNGVITNSTFIGNKALRTNGGAIRFQDTNKGEISKSIFINNTALNNGGAISWENSNGEISTSEFINNAATYGQSVRINKGTVKVSDSNFTDKTSSYSIFSTSDLTLSNNNLNEENYIYLEDKKILSKTNIIVLENQTKYSLSNVTLKALIFDDNNNKIVLSGNFTRLKFDVDKNLVEAAQNEYGVWSYDYTFTKPGVYVVSASQENLTTANIFKGTVIIKFDSKFNISTKDINLGENATITITLDEDARGNITLIIGNETYKIQLNDTNKGVIEFNVTFEDAGTYNVTAIYTSNNDYFDSSLNATIKVKPFITVFAENLTRGYNSGKDFEATFKDKYGKELKNSEVEFIINNHSYKVKTDNNGVAILNAKLYSGKYTVEVKNLLTNESLIRSLNIVDRIQENSDLNIFYRQSYYTVRAYGDDGNPVKAGEIVTFKVHGVTYYVKTNNNGYASLKINLAHKTYIITAEYKGFKVSNKIVVKPVIIAKNVKVKKSSKTIKIKITLKAKSVLKNKKLKVRFKGKTFKLKTNGKGIAYFKIKKNIIKKLKKGKTYKYKVIYIEDSVTKTIKIK
ncbi:MAG: Ig-like domain repeat protein [Methanobrevibacter sp.]|uniref:right-handed parallel beta-helix repeat-containing protein n=1 Tax=Methanobrevibacter sp. TaxID=66852 RepID=UPI0025EF152A|nr:Ig-like domain repeat protein [Methanobrevibacter sp.]MBQ8017447.1 Ig-like domain repeat protein [Methanobrevibacter sp.]